jgi:hypothetical protein
MSGGSFIRRPEPLGSLAGSARSPWHKGDRRPMGAGRVESWRCKWTPAAVWRDALGHPFPAQLTFLYRQAPLVVPLVRPPVQSKAATNRRAHVLTLAGAVPGRNHSRTESRGIWAGVDRAPRGKVGRPRKAS